MYLVFSFHRAVYKKCVVCFFSYKVLQAYTVDYTVYCIICMVYTIIMILAYRFLPSKSLCVRYTFIGCGLKENAESNTNNRKNEEPETSFQTTILEQTLHWKREKLSESDEINIEYPIAKYNANQETDYIFAIFPR